MTSEQYKGIFFDAGNTLLRVYPSIGELYSSTARDFGVDWPPQEIEQTFRDLWAKTAPLVDNDGHRLSYQRERDWWKFIVREVFGDRIGKDNFDAFFDELYERFEDMNSWRLYDDVLEVLQQLKDRGQVLAIISNWDSRLPSLLQSLGLAPFFKATVVSALVGYEKPHPAIFQIALKDTNLQPHEVLYIGDDPFLDYQAAQKAGMDALHLDRSGHYKPHPGRITSLTEILVSH
ncbi:MAG TPA: HAD-IA family hydrolase [Acidobacteriota bacterium]|nr:HAD-IA family hydrolase [Acidobacteriota bacterium]